MTATPQRPGFVLVWIGAFIVFLSLAASALFPPQPADASRAPLGHVIPVGTPDLNSISEIRPSQAPVGSLPNTDRLANQPSVAPHETVLADEMMIGPVVLEGQVFTINEQGLEQARSLARVVFLPHPSFPNVRSRTVHCDVDGRFRFPELPSGLKGSLVASYGLRLSLPTEVNLENVSGAFKLVLTETPTTAEVLESANILQVAGGGQHQLLWSPGPVSLIGGEWVVEAEIEIPLDTDSLSSLDLAPEQVFLRIKRHHSNRRWMVLQLVALFERNSLSAAEKLEATLDVLPDELRKRLRRAKNLLKGDEETGEPDKGLLRDKFESLQERGGKTSEWLAHVAPNQAAKLLRKLEVIVEVGQSANGGN